MKLVTTLLACLTVVTAQRILIGSPPDQAKLTAGQQATVQLVLPVRRSSSNPLDSTSYSWFFRPSSRHHPKLRWRLDSSPAPLLLARRLPTRLVVSSTMAPSHRREIPHPPLHKLTRILPSTYHQIYLRAKDSWGLHISHSLGWVHTLTSGSNERTLKLTIGSLYRPVSCRGWRPWIPPSSFSKFIMVRNGQRTFSIHVSFVIEG